MRLEGRFVGVEADEAAELLAEARAELGLTAAAARALPDERPAPLLRGLRRPARRPGLPELRGGRAGAAAGRAADASSSTVLAGAEARAGRAPAARLTRDWAATEGLLDESERRLLRRARSGWSEADLPLLDEARAVAGRAADPLRARDRGRGAGPDADAAADGRAPRRRLVHAARRHRAGDRPGALRPLARAAAVPRGRAKARRSRSCATPTASRARSWSSRCRCWSESRPRSSRRSPTASGPSGRASSSGRPAARRRLRGGGARWPARKGLLAVIAPASLRGEGESALFDDSRIAVLTPREAKGMEFDHVIVVEPRRSSRRRSRARGCASSTSRSRGRRRRSSSSTGAHCRPSSGLSERWTTSAGETVEARRSRRSSVETDAGDRRCRSQAMPSFLGPRSMRGSRR